MMASHCWRLTNTIEPSSRRRQAQRGQENAVSIREQTYAKLILPNYFYATGLAGQCFCWLLLRLLMCRFIRCMRTNCRGRTQFHFHRTASWYKKISDGSLEVADLWPLEGWVHHILPVTVVRRRVNAAYCHSCTVSIWTMWPHSWAWKVRTLSRPGQLEGFRSAGFRHSLCMATGRLWASTNKQSVEGRFAYAGQPRMSSTAAVTDVAANSGNTAAAAFAGFCCASSSPVGAL